MLSNLEQTKREILEILKPGREAILINRLVKFKHIRNKLNFDDAIAELINEKKIIPVNFRATKELIEEQKVNFSSIKLKD